MPPFIKRVQAAARVLGIIAGLCFAAAPAYAAEEEARVLILNALDPYGPGYLMIDAAMRANLAQETTRRIVLYSEQLDTQRFPGKALDPEILALLTKKYRNVPIDVVVTVSTPAYEFFTQHGEQLWPGARLVFHSLPYGTDPSTLPPNAIGQVVRDDFAGTIDLARRLQPNARRILVISGTAPLDLELEQRARQVMPTLAGGVAVEFLSGWPLPELVKRVAGESADTIVLHLTQFRDRDGRPYAFREVLRAISSASAAPVYGLFETGIGFGDVAGSMEFLEDRGELVGQLVRDTVAGRSPDPGKVVFTVPSRCVADAREMQRHSLDERRLPDGCDIRFTDRPLWRQYWWQIVIMLAVIAAQTLLIAALVIQRRRRYRAEVEANRRRTELTQASRLALAGQLAASIAHEINQPLGAILVNTGAARAMLECVPPNLDEVRHILADIHKEDQRAGEVIRRVRALLTKGDVERQPTDINALVVDTLSLLATESQRRGVAIETALAPDLPSLRIDPTQLQQALLNLCINAMDAMNNTVASRKRLEVTTLAREDGATEITVGDRGLGIDPQELPRLFDSFFTTKPHGMGLGLSITRSIVEAHGGTLSGESRAGGGAIFRIVLPRGDAKTPSVGNRRDAALERGAQ